MLEKVKPISKWNAAIGNFALQWNKFFSLFCFFLGLWHIPCFFFISFQTPSPTCIKSRLGILVAYQIKSIRGWIAMLLFSFKSSPFLSWIRKQFFVFWVILIWHISLLLKISFMCLFILFYVPTFFSLSLSLSLCIFCFLILIIPPLRCQKNSQNIFNF